MLLQHLAVWPVSTSYWTPRHLHQQPQMTAGLPSQLESLFAVYAYPADLVGTDVLSAQLLLCHAVFTDNYQTGRLYSYQIRGRNTKNIIRREAGHASLKVVGDRQPTLLLVLCRQLGSVRCLTPDWGVGSCRPCFLIRLNGIISCLCCALPEIPVSSACMQKRHCQYTCL